MYKYEVYCSGTQLSNIIAYVSLHATMPVFSGFCHNVNPLLKQYLCSIAQKLSVCEGTKE